jgi:hypothetical protein
MQQLQASITARGPSKASQAHLKACLDEAKEYFPFCPTNEVANCQYGNMSSY